MLDRGEEGCRLGLIYGIHSRRVMDRKKDLEVEEKRDTGKPQAGE